MKRIIFLLVLFLSAIASFAQSRHYIRVDSVYIEKGGGNGELILLNGTRDSVGGVLYNKGGGRTAFIKSKVLNDSTITVGGDTLIIRGGVNGAVGIASLKNKGSGYRLVGYGDSVKTLYTAGFTMTIDSLTNPDGLTFKVDTTIIATQYDLSQATEKIIRTVTGNTSAAAGDGVILCNTASGNITVTISTTTSNSVTIQKISSDFNTVIISPSSGTIRGASTYVLTGTWESVTIFTNGTNFFIK